MDDKEHGLYSRPPEIQDLIALIKSLNEQGVRYVLIGGFAVILHGSVRGTKDIDLLVDASEENIQKIKTAMAVLPDNAIALIQNDEVQKYQVVRIADEIVVDLMAKACGIDYEEAQQGVEWFDIEGVSVPVASKEFLIRMKDTIRPSDKSDILFLQYRIEEEKKEQMR